MVVCTEALAGNGLKSFIQQVGKRIDSMAVSGVDRRYIDAPEKPWQIIVKGNMNQSEVKMKTLGNTGGIVFEATPRLKTEPSQYVGFWMGYRGYGLGYTVNVAGDKGSYFTIGATGGAYGINVRIHSFENNRPDFLITTNLTSKEMKDHWLQLDLQDPIRVRTVIADGYYLFNGKHFSHTAAYDQSALQKRSAGSFMAGGMYYYGNINYASHKNADLIDMMYGLGRVQLWQGSIGMGYAYNWVPVRGLLISAMAMPMLTMVNKIKAYGYATNLDEMLSDPSMLGDDIGSEEWEKRWYDNLRIQPMAKKTYNSGLSVNFDARLSVSYNFSRYFVCAYGQLNNFQYHHSNSHGHITDWYVNASLGIRL